MRIKVLLVKHFISNRFLCSGFKFIGNVWCFSRKPPPEEDCGADVVLNELCSSALALTTEGSHPANRMLMSDLAALTSAKMESGGDAGGSRGPPGSPAATN